MSEILIQITSPYFCCGAVVKDGKVAEAAPIIKYMKGWSKTKIIDYCHKKQWAIQLVDTP